MGEEQSEIDFKSYDPKQISIFSTALTNPQFLIKFILGIAIFIGISFLSIGILYIYIFPILSFSLYVFFAIIYAMKSITNSEMLQFGLIFQPLGDESKLSNIFYKVFLIASSIVLIFNLEFSRRPQILEVYGYHLVLLLNLCLLSGIFFGSKTIIETHDIALIKTKDSISDLSQSSKAFILGLTGNRAMRLWAANLVFLFVYLGTICIGFILFLLYFESSSVFFLKISVDIDGYGTFLPWDFLTLLLLVFYLGFFIVLVMQFYSSIRKVRDNFPLIAKKFKDKTNSEKIVVRGLELYLKE